MSNEVRIELQLKIDDQWQTEDDITFEDSLTVRILCGVEQTVPNKYSTLTKFVVPTPEGKPDVIYVPIAALNAYDWSQTILLRSLVPLSFYKLWTDMGETTFPPNFKRYHTSTKQVVEMNDWEAGRLPEDFDPNKPVDINVEWALPFTETLAYDLYQDLVALEACETVATDGRMKLTFC